MKWLSGLALCLAALGASTAGAGGETRSDSHTRTVVLLRTATADEVSTEATARVRGELKAAGFEVAILARSTQDAKRDLDTAGADLHPIAAFAIFVTQSDDGRALAEIWVSDRIRNKTVIEQAFVKEATRAREASILAVRAVELLKASLADFWTPTASPVPAPTAAPTADRTVVDAGPTPPPKRVSFGSGLGAAVGIGVQKNFEAIGTTWSPMLLVAYGWPDGFGVRATVDALGPAATLPAMSGTARIEQQLATIEAVKTWWPTSPVIPLVFAGLGGEHLHVAGATDVPGGIPHTSDDWSFLTMVGLGVAIPVVSTLSLLAEGRGLAALPPTSITIGGVEAGRVGTVSVLLDAGLFGVLP